MEGMGSAGMALQQRLSEYLYAEMAHTFGSYRVAYQRLDSLESGIASHSGSSLSSTLSMLQEVVGLSCYANETLRNELHKSQPSGDAKPPTHRHPSPYPPGKESGKAFRRSRADLLGNHLSTYYEDAASALALYLDDLQRGKKSERVGSELGSCLAFVHDPKHRGPSDVESWANHSRAANEVLVERLIARATHRLRAIKELGGEVGSGSLANRWWRPGPDQESRFDQIRNAWIDGDTQLLEMIVQALTEAHLAMHEAEHLRAQTFGGMFTAPPSTHADIQRLLHQSVVLNTFVFSAARTFPWIFAEDTREREYVVRNYEQSNEALAPTYCMWIGVQFSLLALHRRAYTYWTMGRHDDAYRDYHKLIRYLRDLREPAEVRGLRVPGTNTFIEGMTAMAEHHIGRIYRSQDAHRVALRHFDRAIEHLDGWEGDEQVGSLIKNSRWRINLLTNQGKANYELGKVKRSLLSYARAWRSFLLLVESETHATANLEVVGRFERWLEPLIDDPELNRRELRNRIAPLVDQFATLRCPPQLRLIAADIVMRIGHLLFILKLPKKGFTSVDRNESGAVKADHGLAARCIGKARFLDPASTLSAADQLRVEEDGKHDVPIEQPLTEIDLRDQWPSGSGRFEEAARITEYTLQKWLKETKAQELVQGDQPTDGEGRQAKVAREMLASFLAHTDSTNVKLAQVYRYLMQERRERPNDGADSDYSLDLVCLRRYSSFFPFLPRPSSFRSPGGGYFVRVSENREQKYPFGVAIDPGPDFVENLYRCGFGLADVQMIVLTHDHADHIAAVDAMLALMGIRLGLDPEQFDRDGRRLAIVGNRSVCERYAFFNEPKYPIKHPEKGWVDRKDAVRVIEFEKLWEAAHGGSGSDQELDFDIPRTLRIEPVQTWAHTDAHGYPSQGFLLSVGPEEARSTVLFTGDTGLPSTFESGSDEEPVEAHLLAKGTKTLRQAVDEADVVLAHLSSVPLRDLRELAKLDPGVAREAIADYQSLWAEAVERAGTADGDAEHEAVGARQAAFMLRQLQFGFRSLAARDAPEPLAVSPLSDLSEIRKQSERHLYLSGLLAIARAMAERDPDRPSLLLIGELREELGTFRTRIASNIAATYFADAPSHPSALTTDIGLRVRLGRSAGQSGAAVSVLCTTCDLDNDLAPSERFHVPDDIHEVCVKGEDEGVFYNCTLHDPRSQDEYFWLEAVERFDVFADVGP
jgi:glyoxylase-like metal-dependent hydrolase (beta-lactamase superfamily II)/tetratricopeptide (TPR) repeat protein